MSRSPLYSAVAAAILAMACREEAREQIPEYTTILVDTLVTTESGLLAKPADMAVTTDGTLLVLDYGKPSIVELDDSATSIVREWGHSGSGPGELLLPLGLAVRGDTLITTNVGNGRFEIYLRSGAILESRPAPTEARTAGLALNPDGGYVLPTNGQEGSLAKICRRDGSVAYRVGDPIVPPASRFDLGGFREAALKGEVPDYYRNNALAALAEDSTTWLALNTEGTINRYSAKGQLLGRTDITDSLFPAILARYVQRNKDDSTGRRVYPLSYFSDLWPEGGRLWVLLNAPPGRPAVVMRLGPTGVVERRFELPGVSDVWRMVIRPEVREILFTSAETASLFRVRLTQRQWDSSSTP